MKSRSQKDIWLYRIIVAALVLATTSKPTPEVLVSLGSAAIGGLAGFLVPSHLNR